MVNQPIGNHAGNDFVWSDLTLDPSFKVERGYCFCSISLNMF